MEIYQLSKYENIADRLKRLASNANNATAAPVDSLEPTVQKTNPYGSVAKKENVSKQSQIRLKYLQSLKSHKFTTQETEYRPDEEKEYRVKQLASPRGNRTNATQQRQTKKACTKHTEPKITQSEKAQDRSIPWKNSQQSEVKTVERKKTLSKVKSDSNIKIEDILESFNNYKQNKEKFLTTIGTTFVKQQPSAEECRKQKTYQDKKLAFKPIDNIWNEKSQEKSHKYQRSLKSFRQGEEEGDKNDFAMIPSHISYLDRRNFEKPRLASKNATYCQNLSKTQTTQMKAILSPRGTRIPGKICRNL